MLLLLGNTGDSPVAQAGIKQAEARCPGLTAKIGTLRDRVQAALGRPIRSGFLDFGEAFWIDLGLHATLRRCLEALTTNDLVGQATRGFFDIPEERDANHNVIIGSEVAPGARVANSVIINSTILDSESVIDRGVVVGSRHNRLTMPAGGASLFSAVRDLAFLGEHGITVRAVADALRIPAGGRYASLFLGGAPVPLESNESIRAYDDSEYCQPILGNSLSFEEAGIRVGAVDPLQLEADWKSAWAQLKL
jgi:hypothetical protein